MIYFVMLYLGLTVGVYDSPAKCEAYKARVAVERHLDAAGLACEKRALPE